MKGSKATGRRFHLWGWAYSVAGDAVIGAAIASGGMVLAHWLVWLLWAAGVVR